MENLTHLPNDSWYKAGGQRRLRSVTLAPDAGNRWIAASTLTTSPAAGAGNHEAGFLHDHGGAVFQLPRRQRLADRRNRPAFGARRPGVDGPVLKIFLTVSYVALAAFVGAFADAIPKGRVMFITNTIKIAGCVMMFFTDYVEFAGIPGYALVLAAYAVVGFGAAAYSPAKYGILTELLPPENLVAANGWIEGLTAASIILGTVLGGALISPRIASLLLAIDVPHIDTGIETPAEAAI